MGSDYDLDGVVDNWRNRRDIFGLCCVSRSGNSFCPKSLGRRNLCRHSLLINSIEVRPRLQQPRARQPLPEQLLSQQFLSQQILLQKLRPQLPLSQRSRRHPTRASRYNSFGQSALNICLSHGSRPWRLCRSLDAPQPPDFLGVIDASLSATAGRVGKELVVRSSCAT